jgi:hypothetical protein
VGHDGQGERGDVGVEEAVQATADAVVVERGELHRGQSQQSGQVPRGPLADAVEGLTRDQEVLEQDQEGGRGGDTGAGVLVGQMIAEEPLDAKPPEQAIEDRQGGEAM